MMAFRGQSFGAYIQEEIVTHALENGDNVGPGTIDFGKLNAAMKTATAALKKPSPSAISDSTSAQFINCVFEDQTPDEKDQEPSISLCRTVKFSNCRFEDVVIPNMSCDKQLIFDDCRFSGKVLLQHFQCKQTVYFNNCQFIGSCELSIGDPTRSDATETAFVIKNCSFQRTFYYKSTYSKKLDFSNSVFNEDVRIDNQVLKAPGTTKEVTPAEIKESTLGETSFDGCAFHGNFIARNVNLPKPVTFTHCDFEGLASFEKAIVGAQLAFLDCDFHQDVRFSGISGLKGTVAFSGETAFYGVSRFDNFSASTLEFRDSNTDFNHEAASKHFFNYSSFTNIHSDTLSFENCIFDGYTDLANIAHSCQIELFGCQANGDINFKSDDSTHEYLLTNLKLSGSKFGKDAFFSYGQVFAPNGLTLFSRPSLKIQADDSSLSEVSEAANRAGILSVSNDAKYCCAVRVKPFLGLEEIVWGYGARPSRLLALALAAMLIWSLFYYLEICRLFPSKSFAWRFQQSVAFSLQCAFNPRFSWSNARSCFYRLVCVAESVLIIGLMTTFLYLIAKVNPLVQAIVSKLIPL
jgi:hypothetical protein